MKRLIIFLVMFSLVGCANQPTEPDFLNLEADELIELINQENANHLEGEIFYNIFPISFASGNGDQFGDIQGVIKSLDYLQALGVKGLWLNPIHPSPSYHKYDVTDYYEIDPQFGTLDDFKQLIKEVDQREMVLIMDMVINHSSSSHPWFIKSMDNDPDYDDYYIKAPSFEEIPAQNKSAWYQKNDQYYYGSFWSEMPEFNLDSEKVRAEFREITKYWLDLGVDGFRYDAAKHAYDQHEYPVGTPTLRKNLQFWLEMKAWVKQINPEAYVIAEVWMENQGMSHYGWAFDSMFNFDFGDGVIEAIRSANSSALLSPYIQGQKHFEDYPNYLDGIFLKNHDQPRIGTLLDGNWDQLKLSGSILLTMPGNPYIYYGEELGYLGNKPDEQIREPMKWDGHLDITTPSWETIQYNLETDNVETQLENPASILNHYRQWGQFRSESDDLKTGSFQNLMVGNNNVLAFKRNNLLVIHNLSGSTQEIDVEFELGEPVLESVTPQNSTLSEVDGNKVIIQPYRSLIIESHP